MGLGSIRGRSAHIARCHRSRPINMLIVIVIDGPYFTQSKRERTEEIGKGFHSIFAYVETDP